MNSVYSTLFDFSVFQDPASPLSEAIIDLHNYILFYLAFVLVFVIFLIFDLFCQDLEIYKVSRSTFGVISKKFFFPRYSLSFIWRRFFRQLGSINHATNLEIAWTVFPTFVLILIAVPSLSLLYAMDEMIFSDHTVLVTGYQWYWHYELDSDFTTNLARFSSIDNANSVAYDSYIRIPEMDELNEVSHRLLSVDKNLVLPIENHIRVLVTSADVLHSWAVPSLGIKIDAVPGRTNQGSIFIHYAGVFYGQCSELCGVNHGFMPIVVQAEQLIPNINNNMVFSFGNNQVISSTERLVVELSKPSLSFFFEDAINFFFSETSAETLPKSKRGSRFDSLAKSRHGSEVDDEDDDEYRRRREEEFLKLTPRERLFWWLFVILLLILLGGYTKPMDPPSKKKPPF